jgi:hypothetical protein
MNREFSPGKIRKVAERLKRIPYDQSTFYNATVAPQEALDFLAMLAGLKPVYMLGRGFDDPGWMRGIRTLSVELGLYVIDGPAFLPPAGESPHPAWFRELAEARVARHAVSYVTRLERLAVDVMRLAESGRIEAADEARLLGYPECCVREYHAKQRRITEAEYAIALRQSGGDEARLRERIPASPEFLPRDEAEARALRPEWVMAPFGSFFLCETCQASPESPGGRLSVRLRRFVQKTDPELFALLGRIVRESPVYRRASAGE